MQSEESIHLEKKNARLMVKISRLEAELRQAIKVCSELKIRIEKLEKNETDIARLKFEIVKLRDRVTKLKQKQLQNDTSSDNSLSNFIRSQSIMVNHWKMFVQANRI
jgi:hypothetical protein